MSRMVACAPAQMLGERLLVEALVPHAAAYVVKELLRTLERRAIEGDDVDGRFILRHDRPRLWG